jgi:hypothetical protein
LLTAKQGSRQNGWEWQNRATELKGQILQLATEQAKPLRARGPGLTDIFRLKTEKSIDEKTRAFKALSIP